MINEKDILARLQAGESIDDIANEMTKILNSAKIAYQEEEKKKKEEEEKRKKEAKIQEAVEELVNALTNYVNLVDPTLFNKLGIDLEQISMEDLINDFHKSMNEVLGMFSGFAAMKPMFEKTKSTTPMGKSVDDIIEDWIKTLK